MIYFGANITNMVSKEDFKWLELRQNKIIYSDAKHELRGWEQQDNVIVLFAGDLNTENVEDYDQMIQFPKSAVPRLIAFLGQVDIPCQEAIRLFDLAWRAPMAEHGKLYADYLEHLANCGECGDAYQITEDDAQRLLEDVAGYRKGAEEMEEWKRSDQRRTIIEKEQKT